MKLSTISTPGPLGFSVLDSLVMLWLDTVLLSLLAVYLDLTVPQEFGQRLPPHFLCSMQWWKHQWSKWFPTAIAGGGMQQQK